jgi:hypothetical protein
MANSIGSLSVNLDLESSSFIAGLKKSADAAAEASASIAETFAAAKEAVIGLGEVLAVDWFAEQINKALEYAESIKKVQDQTGLSTKAIQEFQYAASQSGVSVDQSQEALERFTKSLGQAANGNQKILKTFSDLGVTSTDAQTALGQFADGLEKVPTKAQQAADVTTVFGRSNQQLVETLADGSKGLNEYAEAADQLGIVLSQSTVDGATKAEEKLSALKLVITAEWSNVIDQNAGSIENLANAFIKLAAAAANAFAQVNNSGNMALLKSPLLAAATGAVTGQSSDQVKQQARASLSSNAPGRQLLFDQNTQELVDNAALNGTSGYSAKDIADNRHGLLLARADLMKQMAPHTDAATPPPTAPALPGLKTRQHRAPKDRSNEIAASFEKALASLTQQGLSLNEQLTTDPNMKAMYEHQANAYDYGSTDAAGNHIEGAKDKEIDDNLAAGKYGDKGSDIAKKRADELKTQTDLNGTLNDELINRRLDAALSAQQLALKTNDIQNQEDLLKSQQDLATNSTDRLAIAKQLVTLDAQMQEAQLDAILASKDSSAADKQIAAAKKALLPTLTANAQASAARQNAGPLQSYLNAMPSTAADLNDSLQSATVDGLGKLNDGLAAAISGTGSLKDAFSSMASSFISDIAKVAIEETIIKPLASLLGGSSGGGLLGSLLKGAGSLFSGGFSIAGNTADVTAGLTASNASGLSSITSGFLSGHANGGMTQAGDYMVGERGPEVVHIGAPGTVLQNRQLQDMHGGGRSMTINSTVSGVNDPAQVRALSAQTIVQALPATLQMSSDNTIKRLGRPKMR